MCGIAGMVGPEGTVQRRLVERMCQTMIHRGPDSYGLFADDRVVLGVQRLAVIDRERGDQPIASEDGCVVIVLNGEIYNYRDLREQLRRAGHRFSTDTDTEVVVHLYEELGTGCVEQLRGMFAFALWDRRHRTLLLARDRVGKKPLFFSQRGGGVVFASEPRALLASGQVPGDVNYQAIDLYLHYQCVPGSMSAFAAIEKLPPAHTLVWREGSVSISRYWKLSYRDRDRISDADAADAVREALLDATRLRLRSDVPLGAFLSGGVDSSAVVAALARLTSEPVKTFSVGFDVEAFDESASAREVAELYGTDHHELVLDARAIDLLPQLVWHYGEPFADSSALATFALAEFASREVTVVLNGDGGDESFAGYRRLLRYLEPSRNGATPTPEYYAARRARPYFDEQARRELYAPDFLDELDAPDWRSVVRKPWLKSDARHPIERLMDIDVHTYLPDDLLVKMDRATMAYSLEARSPLLDHELMELAAGLSLQMKLAHGESKRLFKQAMRAWLPERIVTRPKMGFMIPIGDWLRGALADLPAEILLDSRSVQRGMFRESQVRAMIDEHRQGERNHEYRLWTLIQLELWFRTYVDRAPTEGPLVLAVA